MLFSYVVLITGGYEVRSAEIFNPVTKTSCSLPRLPEYRYHHSQNGGLVCGGSHPDAKTNCVIWIPVSVNWTQSDTLMSSRWDHVSWATASGVYILGGLSRPHSSEKVKFDGSVEGGFNLKYETE